MGRLVKGYVLFALFAAGLVWSVTLPGGAAASGYEFDGVGARAVGRGGAVTAAVNDWTAIYWNPAGLAAAPERHAGLELRGGAMYPKDGNSFNILGNNPFDKTRGSSSFLFGSAGAVVPLDADSALGAGLYTPLLQGTDFKDTAPGNLVATSLDYESRVLAAVGNVSYSRKLGEKFTAGLGVNALYGSLSSDSEIAWGAAVPVLGGLTQQNKSDAAGYGVEGVAGLTCALNSDWTAGAVFRTGARILLKGEETVYLNGAQQEKSDFEYPVKHPPSSAVGVAWRAGRDLTLTFDFAQTWWKGFSSKLTYDTPGALLVSRGNSYNWENSVKVRLGALKKLSEKYEAMAGYAFDTYAIDKDSVDFATAVDAPMHRFSGAVTRKFAALDATLAGLAGGGRRTSGGVDYSLWGWYLMGEVKYRF